MQSRGRDYVSTTGTVRFAPGVTSQPIVIPVVGDRLARGNKSFRVKLSAPVGAVIGASAASVLIRDPNIRRPFWPSAASRRFHRSGRSNIWLPSRMPCSPRATQPMLSRFGSTTGMAGIRISRGPTSARLGVGDYENAQRWPFQPAGTPGLSVDGEFRGCNTLTGNFQVTKAGYNSSNILQSFSANFEQHCEGAAPALFGWLRYHTLLQQFSVSDAVISGSSATFTVTLNPSTATSVSVNFATADGTAIAGTDYAATSETVTFSPGMTAQTITVPLLNTGGSGKTFYGKLSSPTGAAVWVGQSSATF